MVSNETAILILNACLFYFMGLSARRAERPYAIIFIIIALLRCVWAAAGAFFWIWMALDGFVWIWMDLDGFG